MQIVLAAVGGMLFMAIAGADYWHDYVEAMRGAMSGTMPVMPEPDHPGLLFVMQMVFNYFSYSVMLLSIPLMLFSGLSLGAAVRASLRAAVRNMGSYLLAGVLFMGALVIATVLVALLIVLVMMLGNLIHGAVGSLLDRDVAARRPPAWRWCWWWARPTWPGATRSVMARRRRCRTASRSSGSRLNISRLDVSRLDVSRSEPAPHLLHGRIHHGLQLDEQPQERRECGRALHNQPTPSPRRQAGIAVFA